MSDYISREAMVQAICNQCEANGNCGHTCAIVCAIESISAADVRPVVNGRWVWKDNGWVVCSECNDLIAIVGNTEDLETVISGFNYCPNCGAKMEG